MPLSNYKNSSVTTVFLKHSIQTSCSSLQAYQLSHLILNSSHSPSYSPKTLVPLPCFRTYLLPFPFFPCTVSQGPGSTDSCVFLVSQLMSHPQRSSSFSYTVKDLPRIPSHCLVYSFYCKLCCNIILIFHLTLNSVRKRVLSILTR